jgi:hypothetical protein
MTLLAMWMSAASYADLPAKQTAQWIEGLD